MDRTNTSHAPRWYLFKIWFHYHSLLILLREGCEPEVGALIPKELDIARCQW